MNIINSSAWTSWFQKGKSVSVDEQTGTLKLNGIGQRLCRLIIPTYAQKQDLAVAQKLIGSLQDIPAGANNAKIADATDMQLINAADAFVKNGLAAYTNKSVADRRLELQRLSAMGKLSKQFSIPYNILQTNPGFVDFALANHLYHRIDNSYQQRGFGVKVIDDKICLAKRSVDPVTKQLSTHAEFVEWQELPRDAKGKVARFELMAYGWQEYDKNKTTKLEPVKIITLNPGETPEHSIELVTAKPTYDLNNIGLGMFGHSWLRVYEPIKDAQGNLTNQVAVYSIGYDLTNVVTPDIFEFVKRDRVSTRKTIDAEKCAHVKEHLEAILQEMHGKEQNDSTSAREKLKQWLDANCITCGTFAAKLYEEFTGDKIDGRLLLMKIIFTDKMNERITNFSLKKSPEWLKGIIGKVKFVTHGYFPSIMASNQVAAAAA